MKKGLASWAIDGWAIGGFVTGQPTWRHPEFISGSFQYTILARC